MVCEPLPFVPDWVGKAGEMAVYAPKCTEICTGSCTGNFQKRREEFSSVDAHKLRSRFSARPPGEADRYLIRGLVEIFHPIRPRLFSPLLFDGAFLLFSYRKEHHKPTKLVSKRVGGLVMGMEMWAFDSKIPTRSVTRDELRSF